MFICLGWWQLLKDSQYSPTLKEEVPCLPGVPAYWFAAFCSLIQNEANVQCFWGFWCTAPSCSRLLMFNGQLGITSYIVPTWSPLFIRHPIVWMIYLNSQKMFRFIILIYHINSLNLSLQFLGSINGYDLS
ncbi:hypothetical protein F5876DRAFT_65647 [Lentinula aff. lateritia]|uniref:Uncharacterized protein n=1 Tax=Lentinula aff. lateritia TaxID=2804960 RepID=A0ACC1U0S9_9AGAR|nr:hypothetical protein F5876DRAFT_65647 [Lentinula aff. lateritia]